MPLFSGRGFNQSAQAGFQQGFAAQVQMMLQARAEQIQRDLQAERLKAEADVAVANRQAQMEAQESEKMVDKITIEKVRADAGLMKELREAILAEQEGEGGEGGMSKEEELMAQIRRIIFP